MPISKAIDELPSLSDQDVELLGSIVFAAEKISGPPFRALFTAYDQVLAEHGISPGNDQTYFRFLLRMGEERIENDTLFGRFKSLLERTGIRVEIDRNEDHVEDITRQAENPGLRDALESPQKTRRASFDSALDHLTDGERQDDVFKNAASDYREQQQQRPSSRVSGSIVSPRQRFQFANAPRSLFRSGAYRGRLNTRTASEQLPLSKRRQTSISSQSSLRITRPYDDSPTKQNAYYSADESESAEPTLPQARGFEVDTIKDVSQQDQLRDAVSFRLREVHQTARRCLLLWSAKALQSVEQSKLMARKAAEHDRYALLRSGLDMWTNKYRTRKRDLETEKFFEHMERRADRARNLYLVAKAFTHWARSTSDEVDRTSIARRHILRTRYFNAWKDITAINALKVRRQGLRKFMGIWRDRTITLVDNHIKALVRYEDNLIERTYWRWFWAVCARRAPLWGEQRSKQHYFTKWLREHDQIQKQEQEATEFWDIKLQRQAVRSWHSTFLAVQTANTAANNCRTRSLLSGAFRLICKQTQLRRPTSQVHHSTDDRLIRSYFSTWLMRFRLTRQADAFAVQRLLHRAMTTWKCRVIGVHINERLVAQNLYRWMLSARAALILRVHNANNKKACLSAWRARAVSRKHELESSKTDVRTSSRRRILERIMSHWSDRTREQQQKHLTAESFRSSKLASSQLICWVSRYRHAQRLDQWATDAHFYVSAKHTLSVWQVATQNARKQRRREAYAHVRRANKMALGRRMLKRWQDTLEAITTARRRAEDMQEMKQTQVATQCLVLWQQETQNKIRLSHQASDFYRRKISSQRLHQWILRLQDVQEIQAMGTTLAAEINTRNSRLRLKELSARYFRIESQKDTAEKFQARSFRKHRRDMLIYWRDRTMQRISTNETIFVTVPNQQKTDLDDDAAEQDTIRRKEDLTALDTLALDNDDHNFILGDNEDLGSTFFTSTPRAGYHRTPSKTPAARTRELLQSRLKTLNAPRGRGTVDTTPAPLSGLSRRIPASAPHPSLGHADSVVSISSFTRKLQAQGIPVSSRGEGPSKLPSMSRSTRHGKGQVGFIGFDDIQEEDRTES
ncbi:Sfi1-domain-containing protein [Pseudovirgaria hyperparasitica]|uniref:Sfi1-domain-containing protein n=1 Tax=Pseudovirgaria hyperparasitica TaxID=470096 RepID=A0A6A6W772_9PEZI|nr:Sfi1-domain-containing protein [Pseudovirgaria hyperparasitica]KAF2758395.1 Sfi1-domain-containing protein [Pseudovirgaria hyperparasitica]